VTSGLLNVKTGERATSHMLVVDSAGPNVDLVHGLAETMGLSCSTEETHRGALQRLRGGLPDVVWVGSGLQGTTLLDFVGLVRAAYPQVPVICSLSAQDAPHALACLQEGAWDVVLDAQDPAFLKAALTRALVQSRSRAVIQEERGKILGAQTRLAAMGPAVDEILMGLAASVQDAVNRPDVSLRAVESGGVKAISRFLGGALVVTMSFEKTGMLRPRMASDPSDAHNTASATGFLLTASLEQWTTELAAVHQNHALMEQVKQAYGQRQCFMAMIGPPQEPFGAVAFLSPAVTDWMPEEKDLLMQLAAHLGYCLRVARQFRLVLRRFVPAPSVP
jgi:CheY-like chemotaxis protein